MARFAVEFFRGEPAIFAWGLPAAQVFGAAMAVSSLGGFLWLGRIQKTRI